MKKIKAKIIDIKDWFSNSISRTFSDRKKTFKLIALIIFTILFILEVGMILINNSFYNNSSDDVLQYYTIIVDFISGLKDGSISWFNLNNYFGASIFSDVYYVPIDIFTSITFFLSYLMPTEVAYSLTEFIKIFAGVMIFAYYLFLKGMKNRTIFWMSMIYFIAGGTVSFMAFPVFLSLTFYMPLALIVIHFFLQKKRWIVPIFAMACIFYDFYLGYTILAFISFAFIIEYFKEPDFRFFKFVKDIMIFVFLLLLGVLMAGVIAYPSIVYILEETYRGTSDFNAWILNIFGYDLKLFQPNIYIRFIAKIFTEQKPIGFYGFENSYATEHISLYISIIGFSYMSYVLFMKDKISRIYKIAMLFALIFMFFPIFSYVFSGTTDSPYTRWINMLPIFQVMILAHVFDKFGFEKVKMKYMTIIISVLLIVLGLLMYYYISQLKLDDYLASRDVLTADTVMMGISGLYLLSLLIFGWFKKWTVVKFVFWVEFIVAIGYLYSGPFSVRNKINVFENAHQIEAYLDDNIQEEEFYRVYIDINNLGVEDTNFNRMTGYATNTGIFHSWTDAETNEIGHLLFNTWEYQSKNKMNVFGYYLNHFLGYKYVLVDAQNEYSLNTNNFELISSNDKYDLYEMKFFSSFKVYESYMTYEDFTTYNWRNSDMATEKVLLMAALIDSERYVIDNFNFDEISVENEGNSKTVKSYNIISNSTEVVISGIVDETERLFYKYDNDDLDIQYNAGAVYIRNYNLNTEAYNEVFMEFADGTRKTCTVNEDENYQIKCEFFNQPIAIYIEDTDLIYSAPRFDMRQERAIDGAAYLVYDLKNIDIDSYSGIINFALNTNYKFDKVFVVDEDGLEYTCLEGFYSMSSKPDKLYVFKTSKMYDYSNIYNLSLKYSFDNLEDTSTLLSQDFVSEKHLSIKNGKISLSYINNSLSDKDQLIVIPVAFSDDWQFITETEYETISASGGFLGIIIPNGTDSVDISLKFVPKGLDLGIYASLGGLFVYLTIFLPGWIKRRKNGVDNV